MRATLSLLSPLSGLRLSVLLFSCSLSVICALSLSRSPSVSSPLYRNQQSLRQSVQSHHCQFYISFYPMEVASELLLVCKSAA